MIDLLTTREAAEVLGVGTTSVKRWADSGLLRCVKTPGGHRRFPRDAVTAFMRVNNHDAAATPLSPGDETEAWIDLLTRGVSAGEVHRALAREHDVRGSWWVTADALAPIVIAIGRKWEAGELTVLQEHLASERLARGLARCAEAIALPDDAPQCLLLAAQGDEHTLGLSQFEPVLREARWRPRWAGRRTPLDQVARFIADSGIEMVAMSASVYSTDAVGLAAQVERVGAACAETGARLLLGGTGSWPDPTPYGQRVHSFAQAHELLEMWR